MMTAETGTYRWMAPELYSTVTLRQGEKKHYNHKVDAYSFAIVLWELLHNKLPFEGMSNLQAAYAAAFKNVRPSAEDLPEELATILTSCWQEDPNARPNFGQIIQMLLNYLYTISPPEPAIPPRIFMSENRVLPPESPGTSSLMAVRDDTGDTPKAEMEDKPKVLLSDFSALCVSDAAVEFTKHKNLPPGDPTVGEAKAALPAISSAVEKMLNNIEVEGDSRVVISTFLNQATAGVAIGPFYL
ncbi:hypothetical protein FH972_019215 [Carpinus fangiana]|uniref:Protein kinase domain-containing protein n=1 Tax=Carpinus fangiana TaxID=176857 RepID=A0A5N6RQY8_9ROSI|nr:hypothetical protein FH972_019215 [Carpinus fangiana]